MLLRLNCGAVTSDRGIVGPSAHPITRTVTRRAAGFLKARGHLPSIEMNPWTDLFVGYSAVSSSGRRPTGRQSSGGGMGHR